MAQSVQLIRTFQAIHSPKLCLMFTLADHSKHLRNAFFYGLPYLTKHIVLYDTLLDQSTPEEVEAVLAHELGHWKFNHSLYMMLMSEVILVINLLLIRTCVFNPALVSSSIVMGMACTLICSETKLSILFYNQLLAPLIWFHESTINNKFNNLTSSIITIRTINKLYS